MVKHVRTPTRQRTGRVKCSALWAVCAGVLFAGASTAQGATPGVQLHLIHCWGEQRTEWVKETLKEFSQAHSGVTVTAQLVGCGSGLRQAFVTATAGGAPPDVVMIHSLDIPALADRGALAALHDVWAALYLGAAVLTIQCYPLERGRFTETGYELDPRDFRRVRPKAQSL